MDAAKRKERAKRFGYPVILNFTKHFNEDVRSGMAGHSFDDDLPCVTEKAAREWVSAINALHARGKLPYRVTVTEIEVL